MKNIYSCLIAALVLFAAHFASAQIKTVKYLNKYGNKEVAILDAHFYEITDENGSGGGIRTRFILKDSTKVQLFEYSDLSGGEWKLGIKSGAYFRWHNNGVLAEQGLYVDNKPHGELKRWFENKQLSYNGFYAHGVLQDTLKGYYEDGAIRRIEIYKEGKMLVGKVYAKDGSELPYFDSHVMPQFPGGENELMRYLGKSIRYPTSAQRKKISGIVIVSFIVETDGSLKDIEVVKSVQDDLDAESVRVIKSMPFWVPGLQEGETVPVTFTVPIRYSLR